MLLSLSSSRIFVIDLGVEPILVRQELKTLRRPVAATISDDGSILAVASSEHQVNVYRLGDNKATLIQSISLAGIPRTLEFSPEGSVLSVAYDGGIEVCALGETALATDRRAARCSSVDNLAFSRDGLMLLGSSYSRKPPNLVTISPPLYTDTVSDLTVAELRTRMWTTQLLFPEVKPGYSHVTTVPSSGSDDGGAWVVGYDLMSKTFRMMQVDEPQRGTTYFVGPGANNERDEPGPGLFPAVSEDGDLLALGFKDSDIWVYGLSNTPNQGSQLNEGESKPCLCQKHLESRSELSNRSRLKKMIEGPKSIIHGCPLDSVKGVTAIKWARGWDISSCPFSHRLVAVAPGGVSSMLGGLNGDFPVDGGRIMLFDFSCSPHDGKQDEVTIEVGEIEPTPLSEPGAATLDVEVELERRRTRINRRGGLGSTVRYSVPSRATRDLDSLRTGSPGPVPRRNSRSQPNSPVGPDLATALTFLDGPYSNTAPRSRETLNRAATAAANNRGRSRYENTRFAQTPRPRVLRQIPHESDADNWVPPPPPYTPSPAAPPPAHLQHMLMTANANHVPAAAQPATAQPTTTQSAPVPEPTPRIEQLRRSHSSPLDEIVSPLENHSNANIGRVYTSPVSPIAASGQLMPTMDGLLGQSSTALPEPGGSSNLPSPLRVGQSGPQRDSVQIDSWGQITGSINTLLQDDAPVASNLRGRPEQPQFADPAPAPTPLTHPSSISLPQISTSIPTAQHHSNTRNTPTQQSSQPLLPHQHLHPQAHALQEYYTPRPGHPRPPTLQQTIPTPSAMATNPPSSIPSSRWPLNLSFNLPFTNPSANTLHPQSTNPSSVGVNRSRSRSQDVPRRRPLAPEHDSEIQPRLNRRVMSSQSDRGVQGASFSTGRRSRLGFFGGGEDMERERERMEGRKRKEFGKCVAM